MSSATDVISDTVNQTRTNYVTAENDNWNYSRGMSVHTGNEHKCSNREPNNNTQAILMKSHSSTSSGVTDMNNSSSTVKSSECQNKRKYYEHFRSESDEAPHGVNSPVSNFQQRSCHHNDNVSHQNNVNTTIAPLRRWSFTLAIANQNCASDDMFHYPRDRRESFRSAIEESGQNCQKDEKVCESEQCKHSNLDRNTSEIENNGNYESICQNLNSDRLCNEYDSEGNLMNASHVTEDWASQQYRDPGQDPHYQSDVSSNESTDKSELR